MTHTEWPRLTTHWLQWGNGKFQCVPHIWQPEQCRWVVEGWSVNWTWMSCSWRSVVLQLLITATTHSTSSSFTSTHTHTHTHTHLHTLTTVNTSNHLSFKDEVQLFKYVLITRQQCSVSFSSAVCADSICSRPVKHCNSHSTTTTTTSETDDDGGRRRRTDGRRTTSTKVYI